MLSISFDFDLGNLLSTLIGVLIAAILGVFAFFFQQNKIKVKLYKENITYFNELINNAILTWEAQVVLVNNFAKDISDNPLNYNIPSFAATDDMSLLKEFRSVELYNSYSWFSKKWKHEITQYPETYSDIEYISKRYYQDIDYILNHGKIYLNFRDKISENFENLYYTIYNTISHLDKREIKENEKQYCIYLNTLSNKILYETQENLNLDDTLKHTIIPAIRTLVFSFEDEQNCLNIIHLLKRIQVDLNKIVSQCKATVNTLSFFEKETLHQIENLRILSEELTDFLSNKNYK